MKKPKGSLKCRNRPYVLKVKCRIPKKSLSSKKIFWATDPRVVRMPRWKNFVKSFRESTRAARRVKLYLGLLYHSTAGLSWPNIRFSEPDIKFKGEFSFKPIGGLAHRSAYARPSVQPPINLSGNFSAHIFAELPRIIPPNL